MTATLFPIAIAIRHFARPPLSSRGAVIQNCISISGTPPIGLKISQGILQGTSKKGQKELVCHTQTFDL